MERDLPKSMERDLPKSMERDLPKIMKRDLPGPSGCPMPPQRSEEAFGYRSAPAVAECLVSDSILRFPYPGLASRPRILSSAGEGGGRGQVHSQSLLKNPLGTGQILDLQSRYFVFARNLLVSYHTFLPYF